jgi:hypothetical protein
LAGIDHIENLRTIGRQGAFNYIGTLDAMDIGYGAARWYGGTRRGRHRSGLARRARANEPLPGPGLTR